MARRLNAPYFGKRYIGDSETKILHDVDKENPGCKIDTIPRRRIQMFEWLNIPTEMNYEGCQYCMPDLKISSKNSGK
ncbi:MAG: hypothetical protein ACREBS_11785 [Nitrososphaerales archaeon]